MIFFPFFTNYFYKFLAFITTYTLVNIGCESKAKYGAMNKTVEDSLDVQIVTRFNWWDNNAMIFLNIPQACKSWTSFSSSEDISGNSSESSVIIHWSTAHFTVKLFYTAQFFIQILDFFFIYKIFVSFDLHTGSSGFVTSQTQWEKLKGVNKSPYTGVKGRPKKRLSK